MLSTSTWLLIGFILWVVKYALMIPMQDSRLYGMYAARDAVVKAATKGLIDQDSDVYNYAMEEINFEIYSLKYDYDFSVLLHNLLFRSEEARNQISEVYNLIEQYDILVESIQYTRNRFMKSIIFKLFIFNTLFIKPLDALLTLILHVLEFVETVCKVGAKAINSLSTKKHIVETMDNDYKDFRNNFRGRLI